MRCLNVLLVSLVLGPVLGLAAACGVEEHPWGKPKPGVSPTGDPVGSGSGGSVSPSGDAGSSGSGSSGGVTIDPTGSGGVGGSGPVVDGGPRPDAGPMEPSGMMINSVPKEKMIAFIHFGHSNMAGRGTSPAADRPLFFDAMPRAWMYHVDKGWEPAREPYTGGDSTTISRMAGGPGSAIIKTAVKAASPDYHFVSLGKGNNSAYCSQYLPGAVYHDGMMAAVNALKGKVTFGGIFIMLGITERHGTAADRTGYATCINKLATFIRDTVGDPNIPVLLTDYEVTGTGQFVVGGSVERAIRPQIMMVPSVVSRSALVPTNDLNLVDDHHFQLDGHRIWAERAIQIMKDKGWFAWGAAQ